jgi:hypothetical protein
MRKLFTLILSVLFISAAVAQQPEGVIKKTTVKPVIDGVKDEGVWDDANVYDIDRPYTGETPTIGAAGETNWRALYDEDGIYILVTVTDDVFVPRFMGTGDGYRYDHPEIYFDVNYILADGTGPLTDGNGNGNGHYQVAPDILADLLEGKPTTRDDGVVYAFMVDDPNYVCEYYVPFSKLINGDGGPADISNALGFDITICDNDVTATPNAPVRNRAVWANVGTINESWANMDDAGLITFEGAEAPVYVDEVNLSVEGAITVDNQTLQIVAEVLPEDATVKTLKWFIERTDGGIAKARISTDGVLTPVVDEEVKIYATSMDGFIFSNEITVSITGQTATIFELSYIKNGNFDNVNATGGPVDWGVPADAVVTDGVLEFGPAEVLTNQWDYTLSQRTYIPFELKDLNYIISFKAWATEERTLPLVLEDGYADDAQWDAYSEPLIATPEWSDKTWTVNLTTEPTVYKIVVNFSKMKETTIQQFNFQVGLATPRIFIDSIYIIEDLSEIIDVADIVLTGGAITEDNGTLQIGAEVLPANATVKTIRWSVAPAEGSTGRASISSTGLLTAILDGTVTVTAKSKDDVVVKTVDVEISGQVITEEDLNIIKNGKFDVLNADGVTAAIWGGWTDTAPAHTIVDGVSVHTPVVATDIWRYQFSQNALTALPNIPYVFKFKAWAASPRSFTANFEDTGANSNNRYGASSDPRANVPLYVGRSEWMFDITTEPTEYTFDVIFDQIVETTDQKVVFHLGLSDIVTYIDDVSLISVADQALIPTAINQNSMQSFKVYPNPASDKLHINLTTPNAIVAIYNSVGVKMDEVNVVGTQHTFDVSRYTKGLYFVKANNAVVKFVK